MSARRGDRRPVRMGRAGFSLVELVGVLVLLGLLSAMAAPALSSLDRLGGATTRQHIAESLRAARGAACSGGTPVGVSFDLAARTMLVVRADEEAGRVEAFPGAEPVAIDGAGGVGVDSIEGPPTDVVWFGFRGQPQARDEGGRLIGALSADASVELSDGSAVIVHARTGLIE